MGTTYHDLFAANLRAFKARAGLSNSIVSRRMKALGFTSWSTGKVSECERGVRLVQAGELLALSITLECSIAELVGATTAPDLAVTFPSGDEVAGVSVRNSALGYRDASVTWPEGSEYPRIIRPANAVSAMAHDKTRDILDAGPNRLARYAG